MEKAMISTLWQNHLGDNNRIVVAIAPVDEDNTVLRARAPSRHLIPSDIHLSKM
jgi:hypothetical protein